MGQQLSRRALFRGGKKSQIAHIRPPWSIGGSAFAEACDPSCKSCIEACPESILTVATDGLPEARFQLGECTFCGECAEACPTGALSRHDDTGGARAPWALKADITNRCIAITGVTCRSCGEACGEEAITFKLGLNGAALPVVDRAACTGCGACVSPCPVDAVAIADRGKFAEDAA